MLKQPWGCLITLMCFILGFAVSAALGWGISFLTGWDVTTVIIASCVALGLMLSIMIANFTENIEIRLFCRKHGLEIVRIRRYKNAYGIDLIDNGQKKYMRWPKDFEELTQGRNTTESAE